MIPLDEPTPPQHPPRIETGPLIPRNDSAVIIGGLVVVIVSALGILGMFFWALR